ncbi:MAG: ABC transporter ATP-binding protein [Geminicoccaceae bacterium]|nr:ABC transporter ATP-binding protein [Geminicoccaceae bacterium]
MMTLRGVGKSFAGRPALEGIDLELESGQCLALLGHNGAGKTTLMKLVLGLIAADHGKIEVLGGAPGRNEVRRAIGFLPENIAFQPLLTGRETLMTCLGLKRAGKGAAGAARRLLARVGLEDSADRHVGSYSKGMRQRLGLAQALIGKPQLLILDEPTTGLDPTLRRAFFAIIDELKSDGAAVLLSSHILTELEAHTDRVAILRAGRLVAEGELAELRRAAALPIRVRLRSSAIDRIHGEFGGRRLNGHAIELTCHHEDRIAFLRRLTELPVDIDDLEWGQPGLDDLYAHFDKPGEGATA